MRSSNLARSVHDIPALLEERAQARLPTPFGEYVVKVFWDARLQVEHVALILGEVKHRPATLVRVHSECLTGDVFSSLRCDCGEQFRQAQSLIQQAQSGVIIYLRGHEGRGIGLTNKIRAYHLQEGGLDTVDANLALGLPVDGRSYAVAAEMIQQLEIPSIQLLSNNPDKSQALQTHGIEIAKILPLALPVNSINQPYLATKRDRMRHQLDLA